MNHLYSSSNRIDTVAAKVTNTYIVLVTLVFLLFTGCQTYTSMTLPKTVMFWCLSGTYGLIGFVCLILKFRKYKSIPKLSLTQWMILGYMLFTFISWLLSEYRAESLLGMTRYEGFITIEFYCIVALLVSFFAKPNESILISFSIGLVIFCIIAFMQLKGLNPLGLYPDGIGYEDANIKYMGTYISTIGNIDIASAVLSPACASLFVASYRIKTKTKYFTLVSAIACFILLIKIEVKSGLLGFALGLLLLLPFIIDTDIKNRKKLAIVIAVILIAALLIIYFVPIQSGMFHEMQEIMHGNFNLGFGTGRLAIWKTIYERMRSYWLFGSGPDTMSAFWIDPWGEEVSPEGIQYHAYIDAAHNEYLNVLFLQGVFSLICFIGIIVTVLIRNISFKKSNVAVSILSTYILVYAIQAFFNISMNVSAIYFWIAIGLLELCDLNNSKAGIPL